MSVAATVYLLTYHGERYPFRVSGASFGATNAASTTKLVGTAMNLWGPRDITGTYSALGVGAALAAGAGSVQLQNANGVILHLTGAKIGVELSAAWPASPSRWIDMGRCREPTLVRFPVLARIGRRPN